MDFGPFLASFQFIVTIAVDNVEEKQPSQNPLNLRLFRATGR
jgi:hypothetical protein